VRISWWQTEYKWAKKYYTKKAGLRAKRVAKKVWHRWLRRNGKEIECQD